jgi:hypothetical protein
MLGTSTYAWFTMNKEVQVTGMEVKTKVGSNLLISTTNMDADYTSKTLIQTRKALLEPVSTINGTTSSFFYTVNAKANGDAVAEVYTPYSETTNLQNDVAGKYAYDKAFNAAYKLGSTTSGSEGSFEASNVKMTDAVDGAAYGYVDYTFYLKATTNGNASTTAQKLIMNKCDLDYNGDALDNSGAVGKEGGPDLAWRVAVFADDITDAKPGNGRTSDDVAAVAGNQKGLISLAGAENQTANQAVESASSAEGTVVNAASSTGVILDTIDTNNTIKYYKVTVRLWLEGEDKTCTSETYAALTNKYSLDLGFELTDGVGDGTPVANITSDTWDASRVAAFSGSQYDGEATP